MRRHTGWSSRNFLSPSKEGVRRRLFQSPRKPSLFAVPSQRKDDPCTSFRKQTMFTTFKRFAFVLILGLHLYFFQVLLQSNATEQRESAQAIGSERTASESPAKLRAATVSPAKKLQPLRPIDLDKYTIRINTWRRPEQLVVSVEHHASCLGVAQIQVVWCDKENEPPKELYNYSNVIIERHEENTLNERFNILSPTPTLGILSIDDDVLRPCEAIDAGFFKWIQSPHRMLGFDARIHVENDDRSWQYGYMSTTEKTNKYSMSLTRYCFVHRDYMDLYMSDLPKSILDKVATEFNCEDIAMSFMISSMTQGKPSLLADLWAIKSMIKLYVEKKISGTTNHKSIRDECVDSFAETLGLKNDGPSRIRMEPYVHRHDWFYSCGAEPEPGEVVVPRHKNSRQTELERKLKDWHSISNNKAQNELREMMKETFFGAYKNGLIEKTDRWEFRFQKNGTKQ